MQAGGWRLGAGDGEVEEEVPRRETTNPRGERVLEAEGVV